ncbi:MULTISPECIES: hypothetical protein [Novosphingobium]|uniref:hypothetical protein n=1 Tax=Novosphingobium TaxID=165696 RepID=UPI0022F25822|nr:hypothetical protein [Novosphingobium resinovorum]
MSFPTITPRHLVIAARAATPLCPGGLAWAVLQMDCSASAAAAGFVVSLCILTMAAPKIRTADLVGTLLAFTTLLECLHAAKFGSLDDMRWQACVVTAGAVVLLLKIQHLRAIARQDAYVPLRYLERRQALLGRTKCPSAAWSERSTAKRKAA